jgi:hypothetical protein
LRDGICAKRPTCVVHQDVNATKTLGDRADEIADALVVGDIQLNRDAILARDSLQAIKATRADDQLVSVTPKGDGRCGSYA